MVLIDGRTGHRRNVAAPRGMAFETQSAAFSPAGGEVAVPVRTVGRPSRLRLAIVESHRSRVTTIASSGVERGYTLVAWSSSGRHVFLSGGPVARRTITWYRRGDDRARRLSVSVGAFPDMAAR